MDFNLKEEFGDNMQNWLLAAMNHDELNLKDKLKLVKKIVELSCFDFKKIDQVLWQAGYFGIDEIAEYLIENVECCNPQFYLDGKLMAAIEAKAYRQIGDLVEKGANILQDNHRALCNPMMEGDKKMSDYLIQLDLDPSIAFSEKEMLSLKRDIENGITIDAYSDIESARLSALDRKFVANNPEYFVSDFRKFCSSP